MPEPLVVPFSDLRLEDVARVGGKNASLGELLHALVPLGVRVPDGFATTVAAYRELLSLNDLEARIARLLRGLDPRDVASLALAGEAIREAILTTPLPRSVQEAVLAGYRRLSHDESDRVDVAVRSSATAEDLPDASFAGQQETFLNVHGEAAVLDAVRRCFASLYTDRAISYRAERGVAAEGLALSVGIQRMVRSDLASSGVLFTLDPETGFPDVVLITGAWGLGETVVQGSVDPDEYVVFKPTLKRGFRPVLSRRLGTKEFKLVYDPGGTRGTRNAPVAQADRDRFILDETEVLLLATWGCLIEEHYSGLNGRPTPMDIEWAKDGRTGELFIVQARPETVRSRQGPIVERWVLEGTGQAILNGRAVGDRIGSGRVRVITGVNGLAAFQDGEVLVADRTDPDWEPVMKKASAIVTNHGGRTCHAAIVSRELGIPAVVGTGRATAALNEGDIVTVACDRGEEGRVLRGAVPFRVERTEVGTLERPHTQVMAIVGNPAEAFRISRLPNDGVGLVRLEFVIGTSIGVHPRALLELDTLEAGVRAKIADAARGWTPGPDWYVDRLTTGIATIAAAFWPRVAIVRLSDFKTNEYANLLGGTAYEPREENPTIGFRGASRYYDPRFRDAFALECRALRRVREEMGLDNVKIMVPFCRTPEEGRRVVAELARHGLVQGEKGLQVFVMCEIPANIELADEFAEIFDGFSIGSNDLTQLILGVDRESDLVAHLFDERNPAVTRAIARAIRAVHAKGKTIGICGQAPSDHPEFLAFLVREGIDSIALNPDTIVAATRGVLAAEAALVTGSVVASG